MRGRVMALYSIVFLGSTPIGAPLVGWLARGRRVRAPGWCAGAAGRRWLAARSLGRRLACARRRTAVAPRGALARVCVATRREYVAHVVSHSPLETVARNHGASMAERHGRRVPAHFGCAAAEETVCLRGVGMADRSDRSTLELRGTPSDVERALIALGEFAWYSFLTADRAVAAHRARRRLHRRAGRAAGDGRSTAPRSTPRSA